MDGELLVSGPDLSVAIGLYVTAIGVFVSIAYSCCECVWVALSWYREIDDDDDDEGDGSYEKKAD